MNVEELNMDNFPLNQLPKTLILNGIDRLSLVTENFKKLMKSLLEDNRFKDRSTEFIYRPSILFGPWGKATVSLRVWLTWRCNGKRVIRGYDLLDKNKRIK